MVTYLLFCVLLSIVSWSHQTNSNLRIRLNKKGFDFMSKSAHHVIDEEIPKIVLPNITLELGGPGRGMLYTYNMKLDKFKSPNFTLSLSPSGLRWDSKNGAVKISSLFTVDYTLLVPLSQSGWLTALASDIRLKLSATSTMKDGRPQVEILQCAINITNFDFHLGGGIVTWLVNLFSDLLSNSIRESINEQACMFARDFVMTEGNKFLERLPTDVDIGQGYFLHYHIDKDPLFTNTFAQLDTTVTVTYGNDTFCTTGIDMLGDDDPIKSMGTVWMSDQIGNCLMETFFRNMNISMTVTHENVPSIEKYLKTSCLLTCIGFYFPQLKSRYPNQHVSFTFLPANTSVLSFKDDSASLLSSLYLDVHIFPMEKNPKTLTRLHINALAGVDPIIENHKLTGTATNVSLSAQEVFSEIGDVPEKFLQAFDSVFTKIVTALVGVVLNKGIPIPVFDNLTIADTTKITLFDHQVRLSIDLEEGHTPFLLANNFG